MASTSAEQSQVRRAWEEIWKDLKSKKEKETNNDNRNVSLTIEDCSDDEQHESEPKQNDKSKATGGNTHNKQVKEKDVYSSPTMVFSVIGDSGNFVPRPWPKTVFQTALIEAAKSGGETWILYRGKEQGVSKVVRDAYKRYEDMEFKTKASQKEISDEDRHVKLIRIAGEKNTHDNRNENNTTMEITKVAAEVNTTQGESDNFLLEFEKFVSQQDVAFFSEKMDTKMPVPVAIIVCEGDFKTIEHISRALENELPVIIMKGSGMAADLVSEHLENPQLSLKKKASILFGIQVGDEEYKSLEKNIKSIDEYRDLVGVFDLDRDDPLMLSNIVGEAIVSCWSIENIFKRETKGTQKTAIQQPGSKTGTDDKELKKYSLAWKLLRTNSVDPEFIIPLFNEFKESRPFILNPMYSTPTSLPLYFFFGYQLLQESDLMKRCGPILLLEALKANRCDYVRVLLDQGVNFDRRYLPELYEQTVSCQDCKFKDDTDCLHMQWILKNQKMKSRRKKTRPMQKKTVITKTQSI